MTSSPNIAYFYDPDVGNFHYGKIFIYFDVIFNAKSRCINFTLQFDLPVKTFG